MRIQRVRLSNFLSHQETDLRLEGLGLTLIDGVNGSGKTTLANALYFGLYGETLNDLPTDSISHQGQGETCVEVDLSVRGQAVNVRRYLKHSQYKSGLFVTVNGERVSGGTNKETQKKLDGLLGVDAQAFRWTCVFHPDEKGFASLSDKDQKAVLESILRTDRFSEAQERSKENLRTLEKAFDASTNLLKAGRLLVDTSGTALKDLRKKSSSWDGTHEGAVRQAGDALKEHRSRSPDGPDGLVTQIETLRKAWSEIVQDLPVMLSRQRGLRDKLLETKQNLGRYQTSFQHYSRQHKELQLIDAEKATENRSKCPSCAQSLPPKALISLRKSFDEKAAEVLWQREKLQEQAKEASGRAESASLEATDLEAALLQIDEKVKGAEKVQVELASLESRLKLMAKAQETWKLTEELLRAQLARVEREENPYVGLIGSQEAVLKKAQEDIGFAQAEIVDLESRIKLVKFWVDGFGRQGVVSLLLDSVIPVLNSRANHYLGLLTHDTASVTFQTQSTTLKGQVREKFSVSACYAWGAASYQGTSGGERRRVDLAVLLALGDLLETRNGTPVSIRIFDEPFSPMDEAGREVTVKLMRQVASRVGTVLVTSHESTVRAMDFDGIISVTKESGVSKVSGNA